MVVLEILVTFRVFQLKFQLVVCWGFSLPNASFMHLLPLPKICATAAECPTYLRPKELFSKPLPTKFLLSTLPHFLLHFNPFDPSQYLRRCSALIDSNRHHPYTTHHCLPHSPTMEDSRHITLDHDSTTEQLLHL